MKNSRLPTILYVDYSPDHDSDRRRLCGLRRYAAAHKWTVETLEHRDCSPASLREALAQFHPIGCAAECWCPTTALRPSLFGRVPVVYFSPPDRPGWRNARGVSCDESAVARMAFKELSADSPPSYAVLSCWKKESWARERIEAFLTCCRNAGVDCRVSYFTAKSASECPARFARMVPWAAALPPHCAVFAVNDCCARCAAKAMTLAGRPFPRTATLVGADGINQQAKDRDLAETVSSVRLDFEQAGYLAAKALENAVAAKNAKTWCADVADATSFAAKEEKEGTIFPPLMVDRRKSTRGYGRCEPRILRAMEMIRREACEGLTAAALAARFPGTRRLFDMRFREAMGHSPLDEILHVRLERVLQMLTETDVAVGAIHAYCGFRTELELRKLFRSRFKMSMSEWRRTRR